MTLQFPDEQLGACARLALDTILQKPDRRVPTWFLNIMEHSHIERLAGAAPGEYAKDPERVYLGMVRAVGSCMLDQYIPDNPLSMGNRGYEGAHLGATTGASRIVLDDITIDGPEAVVHHLESVEFPRIRSAIDTFDHDRRTAEIIEHERNIQDTLGPDILKCPYGHVRFPTFSYGAYGYTHYFAAYALYPDVMERHFSLQADLAILNNRAAAAASSEAGLPPLHRLDFDMADSRGTLASPESLDRIWMPHFARSLEPMLKSGAKLIWHCDGNLMDMVPRFLEAGLAGFQGFQYEAGMDYEKICRMKTRDGDDLIIIAGVSVTTTLPHGTPRDVKKEIDFLVEKGPKTGLFLGASSSITPGVPWENIQTLIEGFAYYRTRGRN